jgi:hypothetical protein
LAAGAVLAAMAPAKAQSVSKTVTLGRHKQEPRPKHETNASRQARIAKTIEETYSHRYEVTGGGGYLRFRSGSVTKKNNEVSWATSVNYYLNPKLAVVGDIRGSFGNAKPVEDNQFGISRAQINEYTFMGGASYRFYAREKVAVSAQLLGGAGWGIFSGGSKGIPGVDLGLWKDGVRPAFSLGVSADYNVTPTLALRFTPTWVATNFVGTQMTVNYYTNPSNPTGPLIPITVGETGAKIQNNIGFNVGVLYRFGKQ